jgi:DNA-binding MarR family transcriptional regulator
MTMVNTEHEMRQQEAYERLYDTYVLLQRSASATLSLRTKELHKKGTSVPRFAIMNAIKHLGGEATLIGISRWLFRKRNSVKETVDRMEQNGLVTRHRKHKTGSRKFVYVTLTESGEALYAKGKDSSAIRCIMSSLSKKQIEELAQILEILKAKVTDELTPLKRTAVTRTRNRTTRELRP